MSFSHSTRVLVLFACTGLVLGVVAWASGRITNKQELSNQIDVRVQNETAVLTIVRTTRLGEGDLAYLEVVVMNRSAKRVIAYTFSSGEGNLTSFGLSLGPGDSQAEKIPIANLEPSAYNKAVSYLRLSAVYLEDGSSEGEKISVVRLKNRMLGIREQAASALHALRKASSTDESDSERLARTIQDNVSTMPAVAASGPIASERLAGREFIKEKVSRGIDEITTDRSVLPAQMKEKLNSLILSIEKVSGMPHTRTGEDK